MHNEMDLDHYPKNLMTRSWLISLIIHIICDNCKIINIYRIDPKFPEDVPYT